MDSRYRNALSGSTVGVAPALSSCDEPDAPLGALRGTCDASMGADTTAAPTTVENASADTFTRRTRAGSASTPPRTNDAVMPWYAPAGELGHETFMTVVANPPCPMLMPLGVEMVRSNSGMVTMTGVVVVMGVTDEAFALSPPPPMRTETTRESSGRAGSRSYATIGRGTSTESSASVEALGLRHPSAVLTAPCSELSTPVKERRRARGAVSLPAASAISALPSAMRGV